MPTTINASYQNAGVLATNNSSTPLGAGEIYTGVWADVSFFAAVVVSVNTDTSGTLQVQFSPDRVNVDSTLTYTVNAGVPEAPHRLSVTRRWVRVVYTNGSDAQTYFRLQSMAGHQTALTAPKNLLLGKDADAIATRDTDFDQEVIEGLRQGYSIINKFGRNPDIDSGTVPEDVWNGGGLYTGFNATAAETLEVFSSDANDTAAGSGARTVLIQGLDANYNPISETVTLNGLTPVLTTHSYIRMDMAEVITSNGANQTFNAGDITARQSTTTANVMMVLPAGTNRTQIACITIPAGKTGYVKSVAVELNRNNTGNAVGALFFRPFGQAPQLIRQFSVSTGANFEKQVYGGLFIPEKSDISIRITSVSNNDTDVQAYMDILVRDND